MTPRDAHEIGLLLRFALTPRLRPSKNPDYRRLVDRLLADGPFAASFADVAEGMGLQVLRTDEYGVVLGCRDDGPFAMRIGDFRAALKRDDRMIHGLIVLALASWCFPRAADIDWDAGERRVTVVELTGYLVELSERLRQRSDSDPEADHPELREAWREVLSRAASKPTADGRHALTTLDGMVKYTLDLLCAQGLLSVNGEEAWMTTHVFRTQLRELAANEAFRLVRAAADSSGSR